MHTAALTSTDSLASHAVWWTLDILVVVTGALIIASVLGIEFLLSSNLPTGGDSASHLLYAWIYTHELLPNGLVTAWMPEVFAGTPFLSYYFPMSFMAIAGLATVLPFAPAMKLGMFAAAMALPGSVWLGSVYLLRLRRVVAIWGVLTTLAFLLHEQNAIWGGNLLSTLAGEFAFGYGTLFSVLALFAWQRTITTGRYWWTAALLEAATGFSHGFALLLVGFATTAYLFDRNHFYRNLRLLALGHGLAFFLLAGWLWPLLQMHDITIPNDALFEVSSWHELLPQSLQPVLVAGLMATVLLGLIGLASWRKQSSPPSSPDVANSLRNAYWLAGTALLGATGFLAGSSMGFANIRFFPFVWLYGGLACAWVWGALLLRLAQALPPVSRWGLVILATTAGLAFAAWIGNGIVVAPSWGLWNHSGLEAKPQWQRLSRLFPALSANMDSPRLLFEHDPANNDIGSTRALEALPMFLNHRPVLEGLHMESSLAGPAVYQVQSEVSTHPSSPLARFPSTGLNLEMAALHMNFLYANDVLIRNDDTRLAFAASGQFVQIAESSPFHVYKLRDFNTHLVDLADRPLHWLPKENWMETSFRWFRSRQQFTHELPVFHDGVVPAIAAPAPTARIHDIRLQRHSLQWRTEAVGAAHLVRMAWHPRWRLTTKGQVYLAGPGFMLVVPDEPDVRLEYGDTPVGLAGQAATIFSLLALATLMWRNLASGRHTAQQQRGAAWPTSWFTVVWPLILIGVGLWFYLNSPERLYTNAWLRMRANEHAQAAAEFDRAYTTRKSKAQREEALFWSAKAYELAGQRDAALQRYRELTSNYQGYWLPESLYTQAQLEQLSGNRQQADITRKRLLFEYPNDRWAKKQTQESGH